MPKHCKLLCVELYTVRNTRYPNNVGIRIFQIFAFYSIFRHIKIYLTWPYVPFFRDSPLFCGFCPEKFLTSNGTHFCLVFTPHPVSFPISGFQEMIKCESLIIIKQVHWNSSNCMQIFADFSGVTGVLSSEHFRLLALRCGTACHRRLRRHRLWWPSALDLRLFCLLNHILTFGWYDILHLHAVYSGPSSVVLNT